jgi:hypothetical protein
MSEERIAQRARKESARLRRAAARKGPEKARDLEAQAVEMDRFALEIEQKLRREQITEDGGMRKNDEPVQTMVPPGENWRLIARRRFTAVNAVYDVGAIVEPAALGRNFRYFLSNHFCEWMPPNPANGTRGPRELPPPGPPPKERPAIEIIEGDDPVESWKRTLETHGRKLGDYGVARDLLLSNPAASEIYGRAVRSWCERARLRGVFSAPSSQEL